MRSKNIMIAAFSFLVILMAAYFGATVHSSKANDIISHLNEFEHIEYYDVELVPKLNHLAALLTLPFLLAILFFELFISFKSKIRQVKNLAYGATMAVLAILVIDILTLINPYQYDISIWGYVWIAMSAIILTANLVSVFIKGNA
jgi:hypothetical protein